LLLAAACDFQPDLRDGDRGVLILSFDDAAGQAITSGRDLPADVLASFRYEVTLSGPDGETLNHSVSAGGSLSLTLALGDWRIDATAWQGEILTGTGSLAFTLAAGENRVRVPMRLQGGYFDINISAMSGGTVASNFSAAFPETPVTLTAAPAAGCRFVSMSASGGGAPLSLGGSGARRTFTMPEADVTVSAVFELIPCTVNFDTQGGSPVPAPQAVHRGGTATQPPDPGKAGLTFIGWYRDAAGSTRYDFNHAVTGDLRLYAKWVGGSSGELLSFAELGVYLAANAGGTYTAANPLPLPVSIAPLTDDDWAALLGAIDAAAAAFIALDLSGSRVESTNISGTNYVFNPYQEISTGEAKIVSFILPGNVTLLGYSTVIPYNAFTNFTALREVSGAAVTGIFQNTFKNCATLTTIDFPALTKLAANVFANCYSLEEADLPNLTSFDLGSFENCTSLRVVRLENVGLVNPTGYGMVFNGCTSLEEAYLPYLTKLGASFFGNCTNLATIALGENCGSIYNDTIPNGFKAYYDGTAKEAGVYVYNAVTGWQYEGPYID
jgi:uncharacterized repeat protein (TIGR02543 family)